MAKTWRHEAVSIEHRLLSEDKDPPQEYVFTSPGGSWRYGIENYWQSPMHTRFFDLLRIAAMGDHPSRYMTVVDRLEEIEGGESKLVTSRLTDYLRPLPGTYARQPEPEDLAEFSMLADLCMHAPPQEPPFASAPIHAIPQRTYDPMKLADDPWGADVPSRFASLQFRDKVEWSALKG